MRAEPDFSEKARSRRFGEALGRRKWFVAAVVLFFLVASIVYLARATYTYTAQLRVMPSETMDGADKLGGLSGLAALAGINTGNNDAQLTLYLEGLRSLAVAEQLATNDEIMHRVFASQWDPSKRQWKRPEGFLVSTKAAVYGLLGVPNTAWRPPSALEMRDFLVSSVRVESSTRSPLVLVRFEHADPKFALMFLRELSRNTDRLLRTRALARTTTSIAYLSQQLRIVDLAEHREVLVNSLYDQENKRMMINSPLPYAVEIFDPPAVSNAPTWPRPIVVVLAALMLGLAAALSYVTVEWMIMKNSPARG